MQQPELFSRDILFFTLEVEVSTKNVNNIHNNKAEDFN